MLEGHSQRKLSPTLATPTTLALTTLVANVNSAGVKFGYSWKSLGGNFHTDLATLSQLEW